MTQWPLFGPTIQVSRALPKDYNRPTLDKVMVGELIHLISGIPIGEPRKKRRTFVGVAPVRSASCALLQRIYANFAPTTAWAGVVCERVDVVGTIGEEASPRSAYTQNLSGYVAGKITGC